jgi:putative ABC transport system substrate-binding protein
MTRRAFIAGIGSAAVWPVLARAQQPERVRRIGVLMNIDEAESLARVKALVQGLQTLGWTVGRNLQIDYRRGAGDPERYRKYSAELITLMPDVLVTVK